MSPDQQRAKLLTPPASLLPPLARGEVREYRVPVRPQPLLPFIKTVTHPRGFLALFTDREPHNGTTGVSIRCPLGRPGDLIGVREAWTVHPVADCSFGDFMMCRALEVRYKAGGPAKPMRVDSEVCDGIAFDWASDASDYPMERYGQWQSARSMPRWAIRTWLRLDAVRVERLQEISDASVAASGIEKLAGPCSRVLAYRDRWDREHRAGERWRDDPYVWVASVSLAGGPTC